MAPTILFLTGQILCAVIGLTLLARRVCPALRTMRTREPGLIADVWTPLALVVPMLCLASRVEWSVEGMGWVPVGGAVGVATIGLGWSMGALAGPPAAIPGLGSGAARLGAALAVAGLILLLLGAAHELTIWTGQCTLAIAAVLLWMNTPAPVARADDGRPGRWLALVVLLAAGQGACAALVPPAAAAASAGLVIAAGLGGLIVAAAAAGAGWGVRIAGWTAAYGALLGVGTLSLVHLAPQSIAVARGAQPTVDLHAAHGFGTYAVEGALLLGLALIAVARLETLPLRALGAALVVVGGGLVVWRLFGLA